MTYIIYYSSDVRGLRVAASSNGILGPFEERAESLISGDYWAANVVMDEASTGEVLIFSNKLSPLGVYAANLNWQSNWPVVLDF